MEPEEGVGGSIPPWGVMDFWVSPPPAESYSDNYVVTAPWTMYVDSFDPMNVVLAVYTQGTAIEIPDGSIFTLSDSGDPMIAPAEPAFRVEPEPEPEPTPEPTSPARPDDELQWDDPLKDLS